MTYDDMLWYTERTLSETSHFGASQPLTRDMSPSCAICHFFDLDQQDPISNSLYLLSFCYKAEHHLSLHHANYDCTIRS